MTRICADCPKEITKASKTGRCRPCALRMTMQRPGVMERRVAAFTATCRTPEVREKRRVSAIRRYSDPAERVKTGEGVKRSIRDNPGLIAIKARNLANWQAGNDFDWVAKNRASAIRRRAWCPDERWAEYEKIREKVGAAEAKRMMLEQFAAEEAARVAAMTPFERQMERIRNGARVVDKVDTRKADGGFTLGGIATGML